LRGPATTRNADQYRRRLCSAAFISQPGEPASYAATGTGLLCYLLGIEKAFQVARDPLVGSLFENLVVIEALKARQNQSRMPNLYFFRDSHGNEIDLLHDSARKLIEIKSSSTYHKSFKKSLLHFHNKVAPLGEAR